MTSLFSFPQICRLCASTNYISSSLITPELDNITLLDKLKTIAPEILEIGRNLPYDICTPCIAQLNAAYKFIKVCYRSQEILNKYFEQLQNRKVTGENNEYKIKNTEEHVTFIGKNNNSELNLYNTDKDSTSDDFVSVEVKVEIIEENTSEITNYTRTNNSKTNKRNIENNVLKPAETISEKISICEICNASFNNNLELKEHSRTHKQRKTFQCDVCGETFSRRSTLINHIRIHTKERPFQCKLCDKTFAVKTYLRLHMRTHTKERPYTCKVCEKSFTTGSSLVKHNRTHTNERPYQCQICEKTFSDNSSFVKHTRTHTNEKPYNCEICGKDFVQSGNLKKHIRTHQTEKIYKCRTCDKIVDDRETLKEHFRIHKNEKRKKKKLFTTISD